jgi:hypothetical protein
MAMTPHTAIRPAWQQSPSLPPVSAGILFSGAAGGIVGFLGFRLLLHVLGLELLPGHFADWLTASNIMYAAVALAVGVAVGTLGSRMAWVMASRSGAEPSEGDSTAVIGALIFGAGSAALIDLVLMALLT